MSTVQKVALAIVGVGAITALTLPGRNAAGLVNSLGNSFLSKPLGVAIQG